MFNRSAGRSSRAPALSLTPALSPAPTLALALALGLVARAGWTQAPPPSGFPGEAPEGPPAQILRFTADADSIDTGQPVRLRWEVINAYSIELDPGVGAVATRGAQSFFPGATTTYTLRITGPNGATSQSLTVEVAGGAAGVSASTESASPQSVPRLADGKPDLSGVYLGGRDIRQLGGVSLIAGAEHFRVPQNDQDLGQGALCLPPGVPAATMVPYPLQIVHKEDVLVILYEAYNLFRIVPIGVEHPEELDPTWMGDSVGHWDDDTLVVDVIGFNDRTRISGVRHTEDLHVVERYRRTSFGTIEYEASVEDPNVFAEPVRYAGDLVLHPEWTIGEYVCAENNKDYAELFTD
ncbi:MAG: hypothetical protein ACWGPN_14230, partial [Gammaproteobacteria bacterium]